MRVIAGRLKGRNFKSVSGKMTRPTGDKVKESIFHMMGPYFNGGKCLDLFAGSGSLGIEAISRGMDRVIFIDKSSLAIKTIRQNVDTLSIQSQCEIYRNSAYRAIEILSKKKCSFDLIILDPPYEKGNYQKLIHMIVEHHLINDYGLVYLEHNPQENITFNPNQFKALHEKNYNASTGITVLQKKHD